MTFRSLSESSIRWKGPTSTGCQQRLNGNMRQGPGQRRPFIQGIAFPPSRRITMGITPARGAAKAPIAKRQPGWERFLPTRGASTICTVMCGSGVRTGLATIPRVPQPTLQGLHRALTVRCGAVAGPPTPGFAVQRFGPQSRQSIANATLASASPEHSSFWFLTF